MSHRSCFYWFYSFSSSISAGNVRVAISAMRPHERVRVMQVLGLDEGGVLAALAQLLQPLVQVLQVAARPAVAAVGVRRGFGGRIGRRKGGG